MTWRDAISAALWTAAISLILGVPLTAYAQPLPVMKASCALPTEAEKALCRPDAKRLCGAEIPKGIFAILYCLKDNRAQLSRGCAELLQGCGQ